MIFPHAFDRMSDFIQPDPEDAEVYGEPDYDREWERRQSEYFD